jgi:hypothetical protein
MARKQYTAEEIIGHLRTIEIETGKGFGVVEVCRKLGITEQTYYRWKKAYGLARQSSKTVGGLGLFMPLQYGKRAKPSCFWNRRKDTPNTMRDRDMTLTSAARFLILNAKCHKRRTLRSSYFLAP